MFPDTFAEWVTGGVVTTMIAVVGLLWKIRQERKSSVEQAKIVAVEASSQAVGVVKEAMATQKTQVESLTTTVTNQGTQIADLTKRVTTLDQSHQVALRHIADREGWARRRWPNRPVDLPDIPAALISDVISANPEIRIYYEEPPK